MKSGVAAVGPKVLIVTKNFPPISHSGTFRIESFVRHLPRWGITPVVLADAIPLETVALYSGLQAKQATPGQADHVHCFPWKAEPLRFWERQAQRLPLVNSYVRQKGRRRLAEAVLGEVRGRFRLGAFDIVLSSSPPPEVHFVGRAIARAYGVPLVCDLRDPWSYSWAERYRSALDFRCERLAERRLLSGAAIILANTAVSASLLVREVGVAAEKVIVLPNGFDPSRHEDADEGELPLRSDVFNIVYTGLLGSGEVCGGAISRRSLKKAIGLEFNPLRVAEETRSLTFVLKALADLRKERPDVADQIVLHVFGQHGARFRNEVRSCGLEDNVRLHGPVSQRLANAVCPRADLLLLLQFEMFHRGKPCPACIPGKLFNYLYAGPPILAPIQTGEASEIIERFQAGKVVPPRDLEAIKQGILAYHSNWSRFGRSPRRGGDVSCFDMTVITETLAGVLHGAIQSDRGRRTRCEPVNQAGWLCEEQSLAASRQ